MQITTYIMFYNKVSALFVVQHVLNLVIPFEIEMLVLHSVAVSNIAGVLLVQEVIPELLSFPLHLFIFEAIKKMWKEYIIFT